MKCERGGVVFKKLVEEGNRVFGLSDACVKDRVAYVSGTNEEDVMTSLRIIKEKGAVTLRRFIREKFETEFARRRMVERRSDEARHGGVRPAREVHHGVFGFEAIRQRDRAPTRKETPAAISRVSSVGAPRRHCIVADTL